MASQRSLSSRLTIRLFWIAVLVSLLLSTGAYMTVRNSFGDILGDRAVLNSARFNTRIMDLIDAGPVRRRAEIQQAVDDYVASSRGVKSSIGHFVAARMYSDNDTLVARVDDAEHPRIDLVNRLLDAGIGLVDAESGQIQQGIRIEGVPHVRVFVPMVDSRGREALFLDLIYALSDDSFVYLRKRTFKMLLAVFMIVMTTTMILSPALFKLVTEEEEKASQA